MRFTHKEAIEFGEAMLDAAEIAQETGQSVALVRVVECLVAMTDPDNPYPEWEVDPPVKIPENTKKAA